MKKVKFLLLGILSILLISPVVADEIDITRSPSSVITFESINSSINLTYSIFPNCFTSQGCNTLGLSIYGLNSNINFLYSNLTSSGRVFNTELFPFSYISTGFGNGSLDGGNGILGIGFNNNKLLPYQFSLYFQSDSSSVSGKLLQFGVNFHPDQRYVNVKNSYVRALYNNSFTTGLWFKNSTFPSYSNIAPYSIQLFNGVDPYFFTEKGRVSLGSIVMDKVSSSVGNGFSFVHKTSSFLNMLYEDINFYSVMPYWDSNWSSSSFYSIPSSKYYKGIYIFKFNSFSRNTQYDEIGVISKCTTELCGSLGSLENFLSSLVVSHYICDFSQSYDLKNNCILVGGGILDHVLGTITGLNNNINISSLPGFIQFQSKGPSYSPASSLSFLTDPYRLIYERYDCLYYRASQNWCKLYTDNYNISYTGGYTISNPPDILGVSDLPDIPSGGGSSSGGNIELTTGSVNDILDTLCSSSLIKPAFCRGIDTEVAPGVDGFWILDPVSGKIVYTLISTDPDNMGYADVMATTGGFLITCASGDGFGCPVFGNDGLLVHISNDYLDYGSGFIISTGYYENFFTRKGMFFSCPYDYIVYDTGTLLNVLNRFNEVSQSIGFDFLLPINCSIGAFVNGKNFKFLKDVNLGLDPLMGQIQGPNDPRVYLYRFFDFLLSLGLLFFLVKLYHFLF